MKIQCSQCRAANQQNARFCSNCGVGFVEPMPPIAGKNKNNSIIAIAALISVLLVCGLCGVIGAINDKKAARDTSRTTEQTEKINRTTEDPPPTPFAAPEAKPSIVSLKSAPANKVKGKKAAAVISENANLRTSPDTDGEVVSTVPKGDRIEVVKQSGAWFLVSYNGQTGWMHGNTIEYINSPSTTAESSTDGDDSPTIYQPVKTKKPEVKQVNPSGATAKCRDGSLSYSGSRRGTCSHHGGVAVWY